MTKYLTICAALALTGCSSMTYVMENYSDIPPVQHQLGENTWRVFDRPSDNRMMITVSMDRAMGGGFVQGLTFGLSGPVGGPEGEFRAAAQSFLDASGRRCQITDGAWLVAGQYEFHYQCGR